MNKPVSFFRHVHLSLSPYRILSSIVISLLTSTLFAGFTFNSRLSSDQEILVSLSPYLSTLVDSQDRPEMLRVLQSIADTTDASLKLTQSGSLLAASGSITELDQPFESPKSSLRFFGVTYTNSDAISQAEIKNHSDAKVYLLRPIWPLLQDFIWVFIFIFFACLGASAFSSYQVKKAIKKALRPMQQLHEEIRGLSSTEEKASNPIVIRELEEIRQSISKAKHDLENAKDLLAEEKAKKLSSESYKRLIHDLHNPVAALKQMVRVINDPAYDPEIKAEAAESVPRIADQILKQVTSAKKNLEDEPVSLREMDVRDCISASVQQVVAASGFGAHKIKLYLPQSPVLAAHDPILLKRAIVNLLENGIEAAVDRVEIAVTQVNAQTHISISDDGPGIDENKIALYLQGRGTSGKAKRQAFGLSSVNHIVRTHSGRLIYKKGNLGGASFEIRLGAV